jgi:hypothetical protein
MILRGVRSISRDAVDDILVGGIEAELHGVAADKKEARTLAHAKLVLEGLGMSPTFEAQIAPATAFLSAARVLKADVSPSERIGVAHPKAWGPVRDTGSSILLAVIRKPRWFGAARASFVVRGSAHPRRTAQAVLEAVEAAWPSGWFWAALAMGALAVVYAVMGLIDVFTTLQNDGAISTIGSIQILMSGVLIAALARPLIAAVAQRMGPIGALIGAGLLAAGVFFASPSVIRQYEKVEWLVDPPSYFIETVGRPTEDFIHQYRDFCYGKDNTLGRAFLSCKEVLEWTAPMAAIPRPKLTPEEIRAHRAQVLFLSWLAAFAPLLAFSLTRSRLRVIHDMSVLIWSGGGDLPAKLEARVSR